MTHLSQRLGTTYVSNSISAFAPFSFVLDENKCEQRHSRSMVLLLRDRTGLTKTDETPRYSRSITCHERE